MTVGTVLLVILAIAIYFGLTERVLDRMRLSDRAALAFVAAMLLGGLIDIPIAARPVEVSINVGGGLVPLVLVGYLLYSADTGAERIRAIVAAVVAAGAVYGLAKLLPAEPGRLLFDPTYLFAGAAGLVAYLFGRSRRAAFIAGLLSIILADVIQLTELIMGGIPGRTDIGGAGIFDSVILSGVLAVAFAEILGETRERLQGGHKPRSASQESTHRSERGDGDE